MRGITLIETLIATTILAVLALGVAPLVAIAVRANAAARLELDALAAATERMEQLIAAPFDPPLSPADALATDYPAFSDRVLARGGTLIRRWSVLPLASDPDNARVLVVRVGAKGHAPLATFTTVRTRESP